MIEKLKDKKTFYFFMIGSLVFLTALSYVKGSISILDSRFFYFKEEAQQLFLDLGESGRRQYILVNGLDFFFMFFYTGFFFSAYARFFENVQQLKLVLMMPLLLYLADTFETSTIFYLLWSYPQPQNGLLNLLVLLTPFKWFLAIATLLVLINGYLLKKYLKKT